IRRRHRQGRRARRQAPEPRVDLQEDVEIARPPSTVPARHQRGEPARNRAAAANLGVIEMGALKEPHGGELKNLYLDEAGVRADKARSRDLPSWDLTMRQVCDIEMLMNGAFSPLEGFLDEKDYRSVVAKMRLASGVIWPMPITL